MSAPPPLRRGGVAVYGAPPLALAAVETDAVQTDPLSLNSTPIETLAELDRFVVLTPPGAVERRYVLAQALRALKPGGELIALAPKDRGGGRIGGELAGFGCVPVETAKRHHRICRLRRPAEVQGLEAAIAAGAPQWVEPIGLWSQPGVFSWDRVDTGTARLIAALPPLAGAGADFGCGVGVLARAVLAAEAVTRLICIDIDRRAIAAARRNLTDPRAEVRWADVRDLPETGLDFVVANPPFHDAGREDKALGQAFIAAAAKALRPGGRFWLVANVGLPYEAILAQHFKVVSPAIVVGGYKIYEAGR
jgi:16S rRNA (guanine1207-N2)-methyltransferase